MKIPARILVNYSQLAHATRILSKNARTNCKLNVKEYRKLIFYLERGGLPDSGVLEDFLVNTMYEDSTFYIADKEGRPLSPIINNIIRLLIFYLFHIRLVLIRNKKNVLIFLGMTMTQWKSAIFNYEKD